MTGRSRRGARADAVVIPGVGHFGHCVRAIRNRGLDRTIAGAIETGTPIFGVCVGMQVLFEGSEEDPEPGLAVFGGRCRRLPDHVKVPHIGWNETSWARPRTLRRGHPGRAALLLRALVRSRCRWRDRGRHGTRSAVRRGGARPRVRDAVLKSGEAGLAIYANFVKAVGG